MLQAQRSSNFLGRIFPHKFLHQTRTFTVYSSLLNLCKKPQHLQQIHARFILHGLHQNTTLSSKLVDSYANLGLLYISKQIFNSISNPNTLLYNTILRNLAKFGDFKSTLFLYQKMCLNSIHTDEETYPFVLSSCSCLLDVVNGEAIHGHLIKLGFESFYLVDTASMEMHRSFGDLENEGETIDGKSINDLDYWNCLILETSKSGNTTKSLWFYERMSMEKTESLSVTVVKLLRSTVEMGSLRAGRAIHCMVVVCGLCEDLSVNTALLTMYSKLRGLADARLVFEKMPEKDCVVWNIMISAYSQNGYPEKSVDLLRYMAKSGVRADMFTALPAVSSIRQLKSIELGKEMHAHVIRNGSDCQVSVPNSLIDMFCECDCLNYAQKIFELLSIKTAASWSSMVKGYVNHDRSLDALCLFSKMKLDGPRVDFITVINILPACVNVGALEQVKYLHGYSIKCCITKLASVNTALLISYAKCGCIEMARKLFDEETVNKDIITWNSMISAYAKHGASSECFNLYRQMKQSNLEPDEITFLGLLTTCVNTGLVKEGQELFKEMMETYACHPSQEHYACMVDLLGRAGHVNEARELIKTMPFKPDAPVWGPLLSACKMQSETKLAEFAAEKLISMEPRNAGNYILLSNIYAAAGKWDGVAKMRSFLRDRGLKKTPGYSWLEINGCVHEFRVADRSHPKADDVHAVLRNLELEIKEAREKFELTILNADFLHFW